MPTPGGVMVWRSVCAPWVSFWVWSLMGVNVARLVGDGVAVVVRPDAVWVVVAHGVRLPGSLVMVWRSLCALIPFGRGCSWRAAA